MKMKRKKKINFKEMFFIMFNRKKMLKCLELVLKYTGINLDLATRKKIENGFIHPIKESIKQKKMNRKANKRKNK